MAAHDVPVPGPVPPMEPDDVPGPAAPPVPPSDGSPLPIPVDLPGVPHAPERVAAPR